MGIIELACKRAFRPPVGSSSTIPAQSTCEQAHQPEQLLKDPVMRVSVTWGGGPSGLVISTLSVLAMLTSTVVTAQAQFSRDIPSNRYLVAMRTFDQGEYRLALETFVDELRGGIRTAQARWIDSICYHTMVGECYYQMGQFSQALDHYNAALAIYVANYDWMLRVQFPSVIQAGAPAAVAGLPWGASKRGAILGRFPETMLLNQGRIDNNQVVKQGGVVEPPVTVTVKVAEIVRCTTLAIRHRRDILGPACRYDRLTLDVMNALARRPGPVNHWSDAWVSVQLGCAYAAAGNVAQATASLRRGITAAGQFDHPLTGVALIEIGKLEFESGNLRGAAERFAEATYAAAAFDDAGVLEEAFRYGQMTHLVAGTKGVYPPLAMAAAWAKIKEDRQLFVSLRLLLAENFAALGQTQLSLPALADARTSILKIGREMAAGLIGARMNYVGALTAYQLGNVKEGDELLAAALAIQRYASFWLYHIGSADRFYATGGADNWRVGKLLYDAVLREPTAQDWAASPLECLSVLAVPHVRSLENWFTLALARNADRKDVNESVQIADRVRRHRFYASLPSPIGARLLALRWLLEGPDELVGADGVLVRQDLLVRYPKYKQLSEEARDLKAKLAAMPLVAEAPAARKEQTKLWSRLAAIGQGQEAMLRTIAVSRVPCPLLFPPERSMKDIQASLPPGHAILAFFQTPNDLYGFMYTSEKEVAWRVQNSAVVKRQVSQLLQGLGNFEANHALAQADLTQAKWQQTAVKLMDLVIDKNKVDLSAKFAELAIVPDGPLWYVPFEALPVGAGALARPLITSVRIRYAPTVGLAVPYRVGRKTNPRTAVVVGKLHPQQDVAIAKSAFEQFSAAVPGSIALSGVPPASSTLLRLLFDGMVVYDDVESTKGIYDWSPGQMDRGRSGSLASWFPLPWGGPQEVILPGFHTAAENGLRRGADGSDIFFAICGLMSTGTRTLLISRWRSGGQTSFDLVKEFAQELPQTSPPEAWQRSVQLAMEAPLEPQLEPRLKKFSKDGPQLKAEHPFFWAGYMLVDSGNFKMKPPDKGAPPPLNFKQKEAEAEKAGK